MEQFSYSPVKWSAHVPLHSQYPDRLTHVEFLTVTDSKEEAIKVCKEYFSVHEVNYLTRQWDSLI